MPLHHATAVRLEFGKQKQELVNVFSIAASYVAWLSRGNIVVSLYSTLDCWVVLGTQVANAVMDDTRKLFIKEIHLLYWQSAWSSWYYCHNEEDLLHIVNP